MIQKAWVDFKFQKCPVPSMIILKWAIIEVLTFGESHIS